MSDLRFSRPDDAPPMVAVPVASTVHTTEYRPKRRIWPGLLGAGLIGAAVAALVVSNAYDDRSVGQRVDAGIEATRQSVSAVADQGARATQDAASVLDDAGITAAVKAALAADPSLSVLKIAVDTSDGVVRLTGPAPDAQSRERAGVLAAAPQGVRSVDNQLTLAPAGNG
jgi:hypothetical protein